MSFHRVTLVALATLFTVGMTSLASACCDCGYSAPVVYAPVGYGRYGARRLRRLRRADGVRFMRSRSRRLRSPSARLSRRSAGRVATMTAAVIAAWVAAAAIARLGRRWLAAVAVVAGGSGWLVAAAVRQQLSLTLPPMWSTRVRIIPARAERALRHLFARGFLRACDRLSVCPGLWLRPRRHIRATTRVRYYRQRYRVTIRRSICTRAITADRRHSGRPAYYGRRPYGYGRWHG